MINRYAASPALLLSEASGSVAGFALALSLSMSAAMAQPYPGGPITFVVGYAAGGTGDVVGRLVGQKLSAALGQSVIVENRAGASGSLAAQSVSRAKPDGYTILVGQSAEIAINPHWMKGIAYDPLADLQPIALGAVVPLGLVAPVSAPYATVQQMIAADRSSERGLTYATAGTATPGHFAAELLKRQTGGRMTHVPYKGAAPALNDIIGGHIDMYFSGMPATMGNYRAGQVKLLAVSSGKRSASVPEVPTVAEAANLPNFDITLWVGFFAPRGTPADVVARLNQEINKILDQPDTRERLLGEGADIRTLTSQQVAAFTKAESEMYAGLVKEIDLKPE
jgi:tripartite-type tricarboxylate transporter receptor subunit TctC